MVWKTNHSRFMVAVLAGGDSAERAVSLASGAQVGRALEAAQHTVEMFDPAVIDLRQIPWSRFDACFIALHGGAGEDGRVQQQLESLDVAYTGSGPAASRLAMSKSASKERFLQAGVPTLPYVLFHAADPIEQISRKLAGLGYPLVIKPDGQGSSLGVGFAHSVEELPERIAESCSYDPFVLAEPWIDGREFTVAILGRRPLPLLEIGTPRGFFDYHAKYESGTTEYRFDTGLSARTSDAILTAAVGAAAALDTAGLVRVDVMLDRDLRPWVLEVNTIPGLTDHSLAPKAAAREGLPLAALCDWMVRGLLPGGGDAMSGKKSKSSASMLSPIVLVAALFRGPMRGVVWIGVLMCAVGGGSFTLWKMVEEHVLADPLYQLSAGQVTVTPQPNWIRTDVKAEVIRDLGLDTPNSILDDKLAERISQAFALHPWVAHVTRVQKFSPARVEVDLEYRKPVCMVDVPGGLYPVDVEGVLLPSVDFSPIEARRYPRLSGVEPVTTSPVGTRWRDVRVSGGAEIAALLLDDWNEWNLQKIVVTPTTSHGEPVFELFTKPGTRIVWGRANGTSSASSATSEVSTVEKLSRLKTYFARNSTLEGNHGPQDLDLRPAKEILVAPRTASLPEK